MVNTRHLSAKKKKKAEKRKKTALKDDAEEAEVIDILPELKCTSSETATCTDATGNEEGWCECPSRCHSETPS